MHLLVRELLTLLSHLQEILVEILDGNEISPLSTLERGANLNHPVHHLGSQITRDFMHLDWALLGEVDVFHIIKGVVEKLLFLLIPLNILYIEIIKLLLSLLQAFFEFLQLVFLLEISSYQWQWNSIFAPVTVGFPAGVVKLEHGATLGRLDVGEVQFVDFTLSVRTITLLSRTALSGLIGVRCFSNRFVIPDLLVERPLFLLIYVLAPWPPKQVIDLFWHKSARLACECQVLSGFIKFLLNWPSISGVFSITV